MPIPGKMRHKDENGMLERYAANARLIEEAPALLEALIEACEIMQREIPWNAEKKFRAVIAKAIGSATHTAIGNSENVEKVGK